MGREEQAGTQGLTDQQANRAANIMWQCSDTKAFSWKRELTFRPRVKSKSKVGPCVWAGPDTCQGRLKDWNI